ncbi:alpha/beta-hydrolase superfamily protein [Salix suchowensis]|nr:alpha/beta-hydrolase superfamily protein [Salix suchowensis]
MCFFYYIIFLLQKIVFFKEYTVSSFHNLLELLGKISPLFILISNPEPWPWPPCSSLLHHPLLSLPKLTQNINSLLFKPFSIKASSTSVDQQPTISLADKQPFPFKLAMEIPGQVLTIYYEEHGKESPEPTKNILMLPSISDVSTVEEWRSVAGNIVQRVGKINWRAVIVDWPDYNVDVMEKFLTDFISAPDSPVKHLVRKDLVVFGGGHAPTITLCAAKKGLLKLAAIAAVAPTWAGPLPIVFGRDSTMETRYRLLRDSLRTPGVGWMMYNMLVSNEKAIGSQYRSHVYANPENVTREVVDSRIALTKREGARYAPAAFLTGLLDPVKSQEEFLELFADLDGNSPKRSKAVMQALKGAKGVSKFVEVPGALLPQEEYPTMIAEELYQFLQESFEFN